MSYVGQSMKRFEDPRLVTGNGAFVGDLMLPDMLHAAVLRSQHAHARLRGVDVAAARTVPGVVAVLTGTDIAGVLPGIPPRAIDWGARCGCAAGP
jgi:carbon-monoxide dehydrogenase large subunit